MEEAGFVSYTEDSQQGELYVVCLHSWGQFPSFCPAFEVKFGDSFQYMNNQKIDAKYSNERIQSVTERDLFERCSSKDVL